MLLSFDGLVEAVRPTATGHFTTGVLVNDDDFCVLNYVFDVLFVNTVGFEELGNGVDACALAVHAGLNFFLLLDAFFIAGVEVGINLSKG